MSKVTLGILAFLALAAFCLVPAGVDAAGQIETDDGDVIKTTGTATFNITYTATGDEVGKDISYSAKVVDKSGNTQSSAVSPSSGSLDSGVAKSLTVTAPKTAGTYTLEVEFTVGEDSKSTEKYTFKAVNPITLKLNLKAEEVKLNLDNFGVYFYIDGQKMEDSYTTVTLASDGTGSVSYDWVADPDTNKHTFRVESVGGSEVISGLNEEHTFYVHDSDYSLIIALSVLILIILILSAIWVYRKPIKNYGKPKSRR